MQDLPRYSIRYIYPGDFSRDVDALLEQDARIGYRVVSITPQRISWRAERLVVLLEKTKG